LVRKVRLNPCSDLETQRGEALFDISVDAVEVDFLEILRILLAV
jgi:hypothetical protein